MIIAQAPAGGGVGRAGARGARRPSPVIVDAPARGRRCPTPPSDRPRRGALRGRRRSATPAGRPAGARRGSTSWSAPGESVALVGATGSGKTTVARLIPRFYDVDGGRVAARRRRRARRARCTTLRRAVGIVFEETFLFSDTIAANIAFADPDASDERIERAARLAGAHEFIAGAARRATPPRSASAGFSLSGGQRQRIAIARAILADPRVLILDDATSSVDPTKEHEIRDALAEVMRGRTTIVIAHRPATIALADRVVLLDDGRIVADGTHDRAAGDERALPRGAARPRRPTTTSRATPTSRGRRPTMWMHGGRRRGRQARRRAGQQVLRRVARDAAARTAARSIVASVLIALWTGTVLAGPVPREVRHRPRHHRRDDGGALDRAVVAYVVVAIVAYVVYRLQIVLVSRVGEGFLRDLRIRVFDHLQRLSMPFYDREKAGVIVSRMTSDVDSLAELVQMGLLMFVSNTLLLVLLGRRAGARVVAAAAGLPDRAAVRGRCASIKFQRDSNQAYLTGARPHRHDAVVAAGGHRRRAGHPGLRPRGRRGRPVRRSTAATSTTPT